MPAVRHDRLVAALAPTLHQLEQVPTLDRLVEHAGDLLGAGFSIDSTASAIAHDGLMSLDRALLITIAALYERPPNAST